MSYESYLQRQAEEHLVNPDEPERKHRNCGNFRNSPERAREAGRKGGKARTNPKRSSTPPSDR